jgi:hypothetical protein
MKPMLMGCCMLAMCGSGCTGAELFGIDRNVETKLTITSGVYGQTTSQDDVGDHAPEYKSMQVNVFSSSSDEAPLATATSDEVGFYEIALLPGDYSMCTVFGRCRDFRADQGQCVRLDYEYSVGPGWTTSEVIDCPH